MDRRQLAEEDYRRRFIDLGLNKSFEFLRRDWSSHHGKKMFVKCLSCGAEFSIWNEVLKGRQKAMHCKCCGASSDGGVIKARTPEVDKAMQFYVQGHSVKETAEKFGFTKVDINNFAKKRGLTNGRDWSKARIEDQKKEAEQRLIKRLSVIGFEYLGGYTCSEGTAKAKCGKCGNIIERTVDHLQHGNVICPECSKRETARRNEEKRRLEKQQAEVRAIEREWHRLSHPPKDPYKELHEEFLNRTGVCEICGKPYTVREYVKSCRLKKAQDNGVCSLECRKEKTRRILRQAHKDRKTENHCHRARKYGAAYDTSITLEKLVNKNGLRCAICGGMCDWNDHSWSKYSGPLYPSIDHIVPMSKGGSHTWDNVQVAHMICNSRKGDKMEDAV